MRDKISEFFFLKQSCTLLETKFGSEEPIDGIHSMVDLFDYMIRAFENIFHILKLPATCTKRNFSNHPACLYRFVLGSREYKLIHYIEHKFSGFE